METIKIRIGCLSVANTIVLIFTFGLFFNKSAIHMLHIIQVSIGSLILLSLLFVFLIREYSKYKVAKLIMENKIMHIKVAKKEMKVSKSIIGMLPYSIDVYISYFGVLLGSKIIKFNMDEIALKSVKIGIEFISFVYDSNGKIQTLTILHGSIKKQELQDFVERIRYETGVIPVIEDSGLGYWMNEDCKMDMDDGCNNIALEKSLLEKKERFRTILFSVGDGVIATDSYGKIEILNNSAEKITGWSQVEAIGKPFEEIFSIIDEHTRERYENLVNKVLATEKGLELKDHILIISKDGKEIPIANSVAPIKNESGDIKGAVIVFRDITEEKEKIRKIEYLSYHDQLTGLYNRRFFEEELKRLDIKRNLPLSIIMADLNGLKLTNDAFGHDMGDKLLKQAANIIKNSCRSDEIVARLGGDEFVILLPKTSSSGAKEITNRIKKAIQKTNLKPIELSISLGWDTKNSIEKDIRDVLNRAEDYMYKNKLYERSSIKRKAIQTIIKTLYEKSNGEEIHSKRVSKLCKKMAIELKLNESEVKKLKTAGLLHDIGKIAISEDILNKQDRLIDAELEEMKRHSEIGYNILSALNEMAEIAKAVLSHHENWDGTGYPMGLKGENIPLQARIIRIVDAYDTMTNDRLYGKALTAEEAIEELKQKTGTLFDPQLVSIFIGLNTIF